MARRLFPAQLLQFPNGDPAQNAEIRFYDDAVAGFEVTDIVLADGVSAFPKSSGGNLFVAGPDGTIPYFRGPDTGEGANETVVLFIDTGVSVRYAIVAIDAQEEAILATQTVLDYIAANPTGGGGTGTGGGLPVGTTLDQIPNGANRLAMTTEERTKLFGVAPNATRLLLGTTAGTAREGTWIPTAADVGAPRTMTPGVVLWFRTATQGAPTAAEGASDNGLHWVFLENS